MKRQVITQLTTAERLILLEQIFALKGVEFASCVLSNMAFMFDFAEANLVEMKWSKDECELGEIIECTNLLLTPETELKFDLGMPFFIHAVLPQEPILAQKVIHWLQYDEPVAMEHFVTISDTDDITIRVALIKNEIGDRIADEAFKENRIINN